MENARKHLAQSTGMSFDQVHARARDTWRQYLDRIKVEGGTAEQLTCFYTGLYHTFLMPTEITDDNPDARFKLPHFWDFYCIWDTWHCTNPLYTLIAPEKEAEIVNCLSEIFKVRGWLPDAWIANEFAYIQGGTNGDVVLADAIVKNLSGINRALAYEAIRKDGTTPSDNALRYGRYSEYFEMGYLPCDDIATRTVPLCPSSRTIEYSIDDAAIANAAAALGKNEDAAHFTSQSLSLYNLFDEKTKFFWAKDRAGKFMGSFRKDYHTPSGVGPFYEGTPWHYATYVPHDMQGLIARHGGVAQFTTFLDQLFDTGQYNPGNEPDLLTPWLYTYVNRPDKNVDRVRNILATKYGTSRTGLPGNDDAGAMSSWYAFGAMGFYPNAGQDLYLMSSPLFPKVSMRLGHDKRFVVTARNLSDENKYIQSATLNGKPLERGWFRHSEIANGGALILQMGAKPSDWGTKAPLPPSITSSN
jgi:predicted alpha-1,2-mannosidase